MGEEFIFGQYCIGTSDNIVNIIYIIIILL